MPAKTLREAAECLLASRTCQNLQLAKAKLEPRGACAGERSYEVEMSLLVYQARLATVFGTPVSVSNWLDCAGSRSRCRSLFRLGEVDITGRAGERAGTTEWTPNTERTLRKD